MLSVAPRIRFPLIFRALSRTARVQIINEKKTFGIVGIGHFAAFGGTLEQAVLKEALLDCPRDEKSWFDPIHPAHL